MAKNATNRSRKSASASNPNNGKMRLRVKSKKKKVAKVDTKMPKKPPTAFFYYLEHEENVQRNKYLPSTTKREDFRKGFKEQHPNVKSMSDVVKACGEKWKTMTYEEKVQYYDIATEKRAEFERAIAAYNKRKESGDDQESEDLDFDG